MSTDIELTPETFKWLYTFVQDAIDGGLSDKNSAITEDVYRELSRHNLIKRVQGWDKAWLTDPFVKEIIKGINLYGIIRGIIYERGCEESSE